MVAIPSTITIYITKHIRVFEQVAGPTHDEARGSTDSDGDDRLIKNRGLLAKALKKRASGGRPTPTIQRFLKEYERQD